MGIFEPEDLRYSGEGPAFVAQREGPLVAIHFVSHFRGVLALNWPDFDRP